MGMLSRPDSLLESIRGIFQTRYWYMRLLVVGWVDSRGIIRCSHRFAWYERVIFCDELYSIIGQTMNRKELILP